jgi:hypothetical protein
VVVVVVAVVVVGFYSVATCSCFTAGSHFFSETHFFIIAGSDIFLI